MRHHDGLILAKEAGKTLNHPGHEGQQRNGSEVAVEFPQEQSHALSFRSQLYRRGICLLPASKQQIPRATMPRFGMTILWGSSNYTTACGHHAAG
jgi:hypothetical protein